MAIFWRLWAASSVIITAVLILFILVATVQFSRTHSTLIGERLVVLAEHTAAPFQAAARIGLPVESVRNASGFLERARQTDDRIAAIYVIDAGGSIVHATRGEPSAGTSVAAIRRMQPSLREWYGEIEAGFVAGVNIQGPSGDIVGGIAVLYPFSAATTRVWAMAAELFVAAIAILLFSALAGGLLLRIGLDRAITAFNRIESDFAAFERDSWRRPDTAEKSEGLRGDLDAAFARYRHAVDHLERHGPCRGR